MTVKRAKLSLSDDVDDEQEDWGFEASDAPECSAEDNSTDTEAEIADTRRAKSKKTLKRKRRATEPSQFSATLQGLLDTSAPSELPLSLRPSIARQKNGAKLESRAQKVLRVAKKEREDQGRIRDVIGGWGGESERCLRKVGQRGVVKLFNAIQAATNAAAVEKTGRGTAKGQEKPATVGKDDFFAMIRTGGGGGV